MQGPEDKVRNHFSARVETLTSWRVGDTGGLILPTIASASHLNQRSPNGALATSNPKPLQSLPHLSLGGHPG
jgi:hypothetical protein